jgi:transposase
MRDFHLTRAERKALDTLARQAHDARQSRRALALLDLDDGQSVSAVARRYRVRRSTVYEWVARLGRGGLPTAQRLADAARSGRPPRQRDDAEEALRQLLPADPRRHGYRHLAWTAPLLRAHLRRQGVEVSESTVRRVARRLRYRWKRPRFVLARRDPHWRQAKGGSGAG